MNWPPEWTNPAALSLLKSTAVNYLLIPATGDFTDIRKAALNTGVQTGDRSQLPQGVRLIKGDWPGVRLSPDGGDSASAGPTGVPWVNTNGWRAQVERAVGAGTVWVEAPPPVNAVLRPANYRMALADTAAAGGRWVLALNSPLAKAVNAGNQQALDTWKSAAAAANFFARNSEWSTWSPRATIGVVSDLSSRNSLIREVVNLIGRAASHYLVIPKQKALPSFEGLKALIYADAAAPEASTRKQLLDFVRAGGTLISTPSWGTPEGTAQPATRPGFQAFALGGGHLQIAAKPLADPYTFASDAVIIVSHRYDVVRLWNAGAQGSFCSTSPDGKLTLAQLLIYSDHPATEATAWVAGKYRSAKLYTIEEMAPRPIAFTEKAGGAEIILPATRQYAAIELERM